MLGTASTGQGRVEPVVVESGQEVNGRVYWSAFFFQAHEDCLAWMCVEEMEHCVQNVWIRILRVFIAMVDEKLVIMEARADIEVTKTGVELNR